MIEMRREVGVPKTIRIFLIAIGVLGFAVGSLAPNAAGGVLALLSALLVIFLFLFTTSSSAKRAEEKAGNQGESAIGGS